MSLKCRLVDSTRHNDSLLLPCKSDELLPKLFLVVLLKDRCSLVPETAHPAQAANIISPDPAPIDGLTQFSYIGVPPSGVRDGRILGPRHPSSPHH